MAFMSTNNGSRSLFQYQINNFGEVHKLHRTSKCECRSKIVSQTVFDHIQQLICNVKTYFQNNPQDKNSKCIELAFRDAFFLLKPSHLFVKDTSDLFAIRKRNQFNFPLISKENNKLVNCITLSTKYVHMNEKSYHLFNQIRTFKTETSPKTLTSKQQNPTLWKRIKQVFGVGVPKIPPRDHLENFVTKLKADNVKPEQGMRELKAYLEGHLSAMENVTAGQKSSWKVLLVSSLTIAGVVYLLAKLGYVNVETVVWKPVDVVESNVKFSDVIGVDEAKLELQNVVEFLKNPEKFASIGAKLPKGVLLVGPPGTGKTLLAKAVAGEAEVPFFSSSGSEYDEIFVGVGAKRIRELFRQAKEVAPCVIFIDEIDSIGKTRTSSSLHPHANDTINQLLSEMDGFRNTKGIIVLGATNRRGDLDQALLRPGRFDVEVDVSRPDFIGRKELFEFYLSKVRHQNIDTEKLARGTTGFTGADIESVVNQAALKAAIVGVPYVSMEQMDYARDKAIMGPESLGRITDEETNKVTAYHESGHTVVSYFTKHSKPLHKVTIVARGSALGHTSYMPDKDIYHTSKTDMLAQLDVAMGGRAAEEMMLGKDFVTSGASSDLAKATRLANQMVKDWGMSDKVGLSTYGDYDMSQETANLIDEEVKRLLQESYERAKSILILHKEELKALSEALLKYETLNAEEITAIMNGEVLNKDT